MFDKKNLHHAYVIEGNSEKAIKDINSFLKNDLQLPIIGNPDLFERIYDGFGIGDARELINSVNRRPIDQYKIYILVMTSITTAASNALLKSLEEPPSGTHFFIVVPNSKKLPETLLSRVVLIKASEKEINNISNIELEPSSFLMLNRTKRMEEVKKLTESYDKEDISKLELISYFKNVLMKYKEVAGHDKIALKNAIQAFDYISDQSSSVKMIMEYIALTL